MKINKTLIAAAAAAMLLGACASTPTMEASTERARAELTALKSDPRLAGKGQLAVNDAETAVRAAEAATGTESAAQLGYVAERKVQIAREVALRQANEDELKALSDERDRVQLSARTAEADRARSRAELAQFEANSARQQAERERQAAEQARIAAEQQGLLAMQAGQDADRARREAEELRIQIQELNARETERGLVLTLGDVLFETAKWDLKPGAEANLSKLVNFLRKYPDRSVVIEGHTDSVGGDTYNLNLSQRRADAVRAYLVTQGIESSRILASGKGETAPVASNSDAGGRQQNRRVEVIISNTERS